MGSNNMQLTYLVLTLILLAQNAYLLYLYVKNIKEKYKRTARPLYFQVRYVRKYKKGNDMSLVYSVTAGLPVDHDVVERRLSTKVNGTVVSTNVYSPDTVDFGEMVFTEGDNVLLSLVDVDDAGNVSEPATVEFVAADTIPPVAPGSFGVALLRELPPQPVVPVDVVDDKVVDDTVVPPPGDTIDEVEPEGDGETAE